ncbi:MAG: zf-HC2 domain-containing protein [Acidobacteria bacterium]|nr:zf-HC2 domain-containing protein [Acidobacteriota bacterium]
MMDCKQITEDLTAYLDGELSETYSAQVKSHLASCASCADQMRSLQEASDFIVSHAKELNLRPGSWNAVHDRIAVEKAPSIFDFSFLPRWRTAFAAAACMAIIALGLLWYQQIEESKLNAYISQYMEAREASRSFQRAGTESDARFASGDLVVDNPFMEAKVGLDFNPFRSED